MIKTALLAATLLAGAASAASAATISFSQSLGNTATDFDNRVVGGIARFDSSLGTLNSATITLQGVVSGTAQYENFGGSPATININLASRVALSGAGLGELVVTLPTVILSRATTGFDGTLDFGGTSGGTITGLTTTDTNTSTITGTALAGFIGSGFVNLTMTGTGQSSSTGPGSLFIGLMTDAGGSVTVTYDYDAAPPPPPPAVPLPASLPLVAAGLGALGLLRRRKG